MRILLFAPNAGASLSTGGGVNFVLKQAEALNALGHEVTLAGYHALSREELQAMHGIPIPPEVAVRSATVTTAYRSFRALPVKLSAYDALLDPRFARWVDTVLLQTRPDAVWFHDDIPLAALRHRRASRFYLYVHYPLAGRDPKVCPALTRSTTERLNDDGLRALSRLLVVENPFDVCEAVWTNSTVTGRAVRRVWGKEGRCVPTYVPLPSSPPADPDPPRTVFALGAFSPGKNYSELIDGFSRARPAGWRLVIAGHARDPHYLERLRRQIRDQGVTDTVELVVSASGPTVHALFARSQIAVQPARFEPFGLALLEAMAAGLAGVAYQGEYSGSWLDILAEGQFGLGAGDAEGFARALGSLAGSESLLARYRGLAVERARTFDRERFVAALQALHGVRVPVHAAG